eukprot:12373399-Alexandrium_andersonii.AAC.1
MLERGGAPAVCALPCPPPRRAVSGSQASGPRFPGEWSPVPRPPPPSATFGGGSCARLLTLPEPF